MKSRRATAARRQAPPAPTSRKVIVEFPSALYLEMEKITRAQSLSRSTLIRSAVENYLQKLEREKLEKELAEGYLANAAQARGAAEDFRHVDAELQ